LSPKEIHSPKVEPGFPRIAIPGTSGLSQ
jgi:hypothetical protein